MYLDNSVAEGRDPAGEGRFRIVFIGENSVGKTTLINALLGRDVLPQPDSWSYLTTERVTTVSHAAEKAACLHTEEGIQQIPWQDAVRHLTDRDHTWRAELWLPNELLAKGIALTDTPGMIPYRKEVPAVIAEEAERADAVVVVLRESDLLPGVALAEQLVSDPVYVINHDPEEWPLGPIRTAAWRHRVRRSFRKNGRNCFWVNAMSGLVAELEGDRKKLKISGIPRLRRYLENLAEKQKGGKGS